MKATIKKLLTDILNISKKINGAEQNNICGNILKKCLIDLEKCINSKPGEYVEEKKNIIENKKINIPTKHAITENLIKCSENDELNTISNNDKPTIIIEKVEQLEATTTELQVIVEPKKEENEDCDDCDKQESNTISSTILPFQSSSKTFLNSTLPFENDISTNSSEDEKNIRINLKCENIDDYTTFTENGEMENCVDDIYVPQSETFTKSFETKSNVITTDKVVTKKSGISYEKKILDFFKENYRRMEILHMGHTPSSGDIHITDYDTKTFYLIELKNKVTLNKEDIDKFKNDCKNVFFTKENYNKVGIFISSTCNIPKHGELDLLQDNGITYYFMAKEYITKPIFDIIFKLTHKPQIKSTVTDFDERTMKFIIDMKEEYVKNQQAIILYRTILDNAKETISSVSVLSANNEYRNSFIKKILIYLNLLEEDIVVSLDSLNEYIKKNKSFTKKELLLQFPQHDAYIKSKTVNELKKG